MKMKFAMEKMLNAPRMNSRTSTKSAALLVVLVMKMNFAVEKMLNAPMINSREKMLNAELLMVPAIKLNFVLERKLNAPKMNSRILPSNVVTVKNAPKLNFVLEPKPHAHQPALNPKEKFAALPKDLVMNPKNAQEKTKIAPKTDSKKLELIAEKLKVSVTKLLNVMERMLTAPRTNSSHALLFVDLPKVHVTNLNFALERMMIAPKMKNELVKSAVLPKVTVIILPSV